MSGYYIDIECLPASSKLFISKHNLTNELCGVFPWLNRSISETKQNKHPLILYSYSWCRHNQGLVFWLVSLYITFWKFCFSVSLCISIHTERSFKPLSCPDLSPHKASLILYFWCLINVSHDPLKVNILIECSPTLKLDRWSGVSPLVVLTCISSSCECSWYLLSALHFHHFWQSPPFFLYLDLSSSLPPEPWRQTDSADRQTPTHYLPPCFSALWHLFAPPPNWLYFISFQSRTSLIYLFSYQMCYFLVGNCPFIIKSCTSLWWTTFHSRLLSKA